MMILAAIEHRIRTFLAAIDCGMSERASGFSSREAGDFLTKADVAKCSYCPVNDGTDCTLNCDCERRAYLRQVLVAREAEEDVAEAFVDYDYTPRPRVPSVCADCDGPMLLRHICEPSAASAGADPTSAAPPAAEVDGPAGVSDIPPSPPVGHPIDPHLISGNTPIPVRSANSVESEAGVGPTWGEWATDAISDALSEHQAWLITAGRYEGRVHCYDGRENTPHAMYPDQIAWRRHVAPLIAARLEIASAAADARRGADARIATQLRAAGYEQGRDYEPPLDQK